MAGSLVAKANPDSFATLVIEASKAKPVLVDFWAEWCGPCKAVAPMIEDLAKDYQDRIAFVKVNVDENQDRASQYSISAIPTLAIFKNGELADTRIGALTKGKMTEFLDAALL